MSIENLSGYESSPDNIFEETIERLNDSDVIVYECLNASNDRAAKDEFLENPDLAHPNNEYGNLDEARVIQNVKTIKEIRNSIGDNFSEKQKALINILATEYLKKNSFLAANIAYNEALTEEEKQTAAEWHHEANAELYGEPDENTFYCLLNEKLSEINPKTPEEEQKFIELKGKIGYVPENVTPRFKPKTETVERFSEIVKDFYGGFLEHIPEEKEEFTSEEAVGIVNEILNDEFDGDAGYRAVIDSSTSNASANHEERVIKFPEGKVYSRKKAASLIVHELGTHVMRAIPYIDSDIDAFSKELPGNETFDEGVAKCLEQAIAGKYEDSGIDHYINIGLATFKNKNFREIFEIQNTMKELLGQKTTTVLNAVQRCFRGTGELPNNKDLAYYNGANVVWKYIEDHIDDPDLMDNLFLTGKTNLLDKDQNRLVYEMKTGGL